MQRIQRSRKKGYKQPSGTVYVGRPTVFGNWFKIGERPALDQFSMFDFDDSLLYSELVTISINKDNINKIKDFIPCGGFGEVMMYGIEASEQIDLIGKENIRFKPQMHSNVYPVPNAEEAVRLYEKYQLPKQKELLLQIKAERLSCFCSLNDACHADSIISFIKKINND